jgi:hypothetical protein
MDVYWIESADGNRFKVGSECVMKTGDRTMISEVRRRKLAAKKAQERTRIAAAVELLKTPRIQERLDKMEGKGWQTALSYCNYLLAYAGHTGRLRMARLIERADQMGP